MKTLTEIKNNYAQEQGYEDWAQLCREAMPLIYDMELHMNEVCLRAQKEALKNAAKNVKIEHRNTLSNVRTAVDGIGGNGQIYTVDRTSITNENNLIR